MDEIVGGRALWLLGGMLVIALAVLVYFAHYNNFSQQSAPVVFQPYNGPLPQPTLQIAASKNKLPTTPVPAKATPYATSVSATPVPQVIEQAQPTPAISVVPPGGSLVLVMRPGDKVFVGDKSLRMVSVSPANVDFENRVLFELLRNGTAIDYFTMHANRTVYAKNGIFLRVNNFSANSYANIFVREDSTA